MKNFIFILLTLFYPFCDCRADTPDLDIPTLEKAGLDSKNIDTYIEDVETIQNMQTSTTGPYQSFTYCRLGGFTFLYYPCGCEIAIGHRFRSKYFGFGPILSVSASPFFLPAILFKIEALCYPIKGKNYYFGIMPGIGIAKGEFFYNHNWSFCPGLEAVFGKEFVSSSNKRSFFYISISPLLVTSFNYGWFF